MNEGKGSERERKRETHGPKVKKKKNCLLQPGPIVFALPHFHSFSLKKKEKDDEKVRKFRVGRH